MLEQALQENTRALTEFNRLIGRLLADQAAITAIAYREAKAIEAEPRTTDQVQVSENNSTSRTPDLLPPAAAAASTTAPAASSEQPAAGSVTKEQLTKAVLALAASKGREVAINLLGQFGAAKVSDLKPEQYAPMFELTTQALA